MGRIRIRNFKNTIVVGSGINHSRSIILLTSSNFFVILNYLVYRIFVGSAELMKPNLLVFPQKGGSSFKILTPALQHCFFEL